MPTPQKQPGPRKVPFFLHAPVDTSTEAQRQSAGVDLLRRCGYVVLLLGQYKRRTECEKCGHWQWPAGGYGNTPGTPDTVITHPKRWPANCWHFQEWKRPKKKRRAEQIDLAEMGCSVFIEHHRSAIADILDFEQRLGVEPNPMLIAVLKNNP